MSWAEQTVPSSEASKLKQTHTNNNKNQTATDRNDVIRSRAHSIRPKTAGETEAASPGSRVSFLSTAELLISRTTSDIFIFWDKQ